MKTSVPHTDQTVQNSNLKSGQTSGTRPYTRFNDDGTSTRQSTASIWIRAITIPLTILTVICIFAFYSGKNKSKPIDWIYVNAMNGKQKVELPDGSNIIIREGSSVSYPSDYGKTRRYVQLNGEAYFEIQHDTLMPFSVKARNEITASAGSSFLIRSNDSVELIIVSKGHVRLESDKSKGQYVTVSAGHKAELIGNRIIRSSASGANYFAWTNEQLIFNQTPLIQVAADISAYYEIQVNISEEIDAKAITITAQYNNLSLSDILNEIALQSELLIKKEGNIIRITNPVPIKAAKPGSEKPVTPVKKRKSWLQRIFSRN